METLTPSTRQYGLDWIRVLAFSLLIFYHTGMFFVTWDFHLKNAATSQSMEIWMLFMNQWRLSLLFFISGAGVSFALRKRSGWQFTKERFQRLFIPIVFGMLVIVPPQIYFERLYRHQFEGSYWDFYPSVFQFVPYPEGGSLSWHHLWFVVYLFVYSLIGLPLFLYFRRENGQRLLQKIVSAVSAKPALLFTAIVPIWVYFITLSPSFEITHALVGDWFNHALSFTIFVFGYVIASQPALLESIQRIRKASLLVAIACISAMMIIYSLPNRDLISWPPKVGDFDAYSGHFYLYMTLKSINLWCWILALTGYALKYLNFSNRFLRYGNEAVYPFYILHQSVMIPIGYYVIQWNMGVVPKFFIIAFAMFGTTMLIYELLIRRFNLMRLLFGLKPKAKAAESVALQTAEA
jgi:hypothetical protein